MILPVPRTRRRATVCRPSGRSLCGAAATCTRSPKARGPDLCERCGALLDAPLSDLLRLQNVATRRRDRISSDEEERQRQGYEVRTAVQFAEHRRAGRQTDRASDREDGERSFATLDLRARRDDLARQPRLDADAQDKEQLRVRARHRARLLGERRRWRPRRPDDPLSERHKRVIPFVEDHRNCLLSTPLVALEAEQMASLQAALKRAIQAVFQLEDQELAAEPLPTG